MAFITDANARRIIETTEIKELNLGGNLFPTKIYFFSDYEKTKLLAYKEFVENASKFMRELYKPIELKKDTYTLIYEYDKEKPAFHKTQSCSHLNRDYKNYTIPDSIRYKENGQLDFKRIHEFRKWFKTVEHLFENDKAAFVFRLKQRWQIDTNPEALELSNSGPQEFNNYDIIELKQKINELIKQAGRYYYLNSKNKSILSRFSKYTFLAYKEDDIENNNTGYSDNEVKKFLREYDGLFKRPLKKLLREYYRNQYNPELNFQSELLLTLNFKPCSNCYDGGSSVEDIDINSGQFIEHGKFTENNDDDDEFMNDYMKSFEEIRKRKFNTDNKFS